MLTSCEWNTWKVFFFPLDFIVLGLLNELRLLGKSRSYRGSILSRQLCKCNCCNGESLCYGEQLDSSAAPSGVCVVFKSCSVEQHMLWMSHSFSSVDVQVAREHPSWVYLDCTTYGTAALCLSKNWPAVRTQHQAPTLMPHLRKSWRVSFCNETYQSFY